MRKTPKIISRDIKARAVTSVTPSVSSPILEPFVKPQETDADRLFRLISNHSEDGYCFADNENGMSWIRREDIEEQGPNVVVVRFRCPPERMKEIYFKKMAEGVCKVLNCKLHFFHETRYAYEIPYEECIWVIQKDEILAIEGCTEA